MDWTQFFNPSAWGSFAPSMMSPAANQVAAPSGVPDGIGKGAPASPMAAPANPQAGNMFNMGMKMLQPQPMQTPPMQLQMARPVGVGNYRGMLG